MFSTKKCNLKTKLLLKSQSKIRLQKMIWNKDRTQNFKLCLLSTGFRNSMIYPCFNPKFSVWKLLSIVYRTHQKAELSDWGWRSFKDCIRMCNVGPYKFVERSSNTKLPALPKFWRILKSTISKCLNSYLVDVPSLKQSNYFAAVFRLPAKALRRCRQRFNLE